jgi:hypothetical protein
MKTTHQTKLFHSLIGIDSKPPKYAAFGFPLGTLADFDSYISGYRCAAESIYQKFAESSIYDNDVHDILVFPLCFLYRHMVELIIKYLFIKYSNQCVDEIRRFIKDSSHKLTKAWEGTRPYIENLLSKFPSSDFKLDVLEGIIEHIDDFDGDSMRMRYPITKELQATNNNPVLLDVKQLHNGMMDFVDDLQKMNGFLDNVLTDNNYSPEFFKEFSDIVKKSTGFFLNIHQAIREYNPKPKMKGDGIINLVDVKSGPTKLETELERLVSITDTQTVAVLMILLHTGADLAYGYGCFKLAETDEQRGKDLIMGLQITMKERDIILSIKDNAHKWNISEKLIYGDPQWLLKSISTIRCEWNRCFSECLI